MTTKNLVLILSLALTFVSCKSKETGTVAGKIYPDLAEYKSEMNAIGEYGFGDTSLFSRSLFCIHQVQSTLSHIIVIGDLKNDTFSTISLAVVKYESYNRQKVSIKRQYDLPYVLVKTLRKISRAQSRKIFSFCDRYVQSGIFYPWNEPEKRSVEEGLITDLFDLTIYANGGQLYAYDWHKKSMDSCYNFINEVCHYRKMAEELHYPWIDDSDYLTQAWRWDSLDVIMPR